MENVHKEKLNGLEIEIFQDQDAMSPAEDQDTGAFLVFYHRDFHVEAPKNKAGYLIARKDEIIAHFSGEKIDPASSFAGAVLCSKKEWRMRKSAHKYAAGLVETWNNYLSGNVYGYNISDAAGGLVDSCFGFYGDYDKKGGALLEARAVVKHLTNDGKTDHTGQLLMAL